MKVIKLITQCCVILFFVSIWRDKSKLFVFKNKNKNKNITLIDLKYEGASIISTYKTSFVTQCTYSTFVTHLQNFVSYFEMLEYFDNKVVSKKKTLMKFEVFLNHENI